MKPQKKYQVRNKKIIFSKGPIRLIDCDVRRPDGKVLNRQILEHPGCVVIVPQTKQGRYLLVSSIVNQSKKIFGNCRPVAGSPGNPLRMPRVES